jgi:hypothetical protein
MHGARGGAPEGKRNGNYRHGARTKATINRCVDVRLGKILLQKSLNPERLFFRLKPKQARTANKGDSRPITEGTGEFSARSCDPSHPYMKNARMAQKFCDRGRKTTFATLSAQSGHPFGGKVTVGLRNTKSVFTDYGFFIVTNAVKYPYGPQFRSGYVVYPTHS